MNGAKKQKAVNQTIYSFLFLDECGDVIRTGFEPTTDSLEGCCSIQLSYRTLPACLRMQKYGNSQNKKNI